MKDFEKYIQLFYDKAMDYAPDVLKAIVVLIIGLWLIRMVMKLLNRGMEKAGSDPSLQKFLASLVGIALKAMLLISVIGMLGIESTSFVAVLGAAGLAVGLALQGSLANFAGGVLILLFKPFKVGDFINAAGHAGSVESIQVFNTVLKTPDNITIIIPNGAVSSGSITNYTTEPERRVDFVFGIGYSDDIDKAKKLLEDVILGDERVLDNPGNLVAVSELADSSVNFTVRAWVKGSDYWGLYFDMFEKVKKTFDANNISIPFPQTDVHLHNQN
jgi:small conductance mechanosensitive channel